MPPESVRQRVNRVELPFNRSGVDPYGIDKDYLNFTFEALGWFYRNYFRVRTSGAANVPARGKAMLVGNHSGGIAIDAAMALTACFFELDPPRLAQGMAEKFINRMPFASVMASRAGQFTGLPEHARRLLMDDRLLMVFPEGARGTAKLYNERHSLVDFGTGFMRLAMETRTPIVPFAVLGGSEAFPTVINSYTLGKLMRVPYVPIVPYLLPLPLPAHMEVFFAPPVFFEGTGAEEDEVILRNTEQVKSIIAGLISENQGAYRTLGAAR